MESLGTLLLVDDSPLNLEMLSRRLRRAGYRVYTAQSAREGLEMLDRHPIECCLFDVMMPEVSGLEALVELRERRTLDEMPVIMVTAMDRSEDMVIALQLGANDYVTKPIDFPVLLARVRTQLHLSRLTKAKQEFLQIASHDLKNPISEVMGITELVSQLVPEGATMTADMAKLLTLANKSARRMQSIVESYLDLQALEDGAVKLEREPVSLNALVREIGDHQALLAERKAIAIALELADVDVLVEADPARLTQVLQNLVGNAIKFCSAGAHVTLRTLCHDGRVTVEVSDTGPGLQPGDFDRVFTRFSKLGNQPTGGEKSTGLGLAICKQLVLAHGGQIGVRNNNDRGATFFVCLPVNGAELPERRREAGDEGRVPPCVIPIGTNRKTS